MERLWVEDMIKSEMAPSMSGKQVIMSNGKCLIKSYINDVLVLHYDLTLLITSNVH